MICLNLDGANCAADYEADGKFVENQGPQLVKLFPKFRLKKYLKHLVLPPDSDRPLQFYTKRVGFNNIVVSSPMSLIVPPSTFIYSS